MKKFMATVGIVAMLTAASLGYTGCAKKSSIPSENGTVEVLFSKSYDCESRLEQMVLNASQVKAALYDLDSAKLTAALARQGAELLIDEDQYEGFGQKIGGTGLMHNKFWLLYNVNGEDYLATGSLNPTRNGFGKNDNNLLIISSEYLKNNYEQEFEELKNGWKDKPTTYRLVNLSGSLIENYFCPDDGCEDKVLATLKKARQSIYFMTFSFTSDPLGDYIISRKGELDIQGVFEKSQANSQKQYTEYYKMLEQGMKVRLDNNPNNMHHKVFIIDGKIVVAGSYNPTASGNERNDENILIIHDEKIGARFLEEYRRVWQQANNGTAQ
ncbi:hypothetical protein JXB28_04145 [Candidatus Woesearchaeota archaeon]|nr:hypothetical protein [Candidatus Woesearchaeota archaeon]